MQIAIIANDGKKAEMVAFLLKCKDGVEEVELVATGNTGSHVETAGLRVHRYL